MLVVTLQCVSWSVRNNDVVETVTFETETWLKFRDETKSETSSKTPRLET